MLALPNQKRSSKHYRFLLSQIKGRRAEAQSLSQSSTRYLEWLREKSVPEARSGSAMARRVLRYGNTTDACAAAAAKGALLALTGTPVNRVGVPSPYGVRFEILVK